MSPNQCKMSKTFLLTLFLLNLIISGSLAAWPWSSSHKTTQPPKTTTGWSSSGVSTEEPANSNELYPYRTVVYHSPDTNETYSQESDISNFLGYRTRCDIDRQREADSCFTRALLFGNCDLVWPDCYEKMGRFCRDRLSGLECFVNYGEECIPHFAGSRAQRYLAETRHRWVDFCSSDRHKELFVESVQCFNDYSPLPVHYCAIAFAEKFHYLLVRTTANNYTLLNGICCATSQLMDCISSRVMGICGDQFTTLQSAYFAQVYFTQLMRNFYVRLEGDLGLGSGFVCKQNNLEESCAVEGVPANILDKFKGFDDQMFDSKVMQDPLRFRQTSFSYAHLLSLFYMIPFNTS